MQVICQKSETRTRLDIKMIIIPDYAYIHITQIMQKGLNLKQISNKKWFIKRELK
jgi:hypothetical protein